MPTEKPRVTITIDEDRLAKIEDYRYRNRIKNQTQAILSLVERGFVELQRGESALHGPMISALPPCAAAQDDVHAMAELLLKLGVIREGTIIEVQDRDFMQSILHTACIYFSSKQPKKE